VKPVVGVVGAFDRFNFGDLLFPHMVRFAFEKLGVDAEHRHFSLRAADLRNRGGVLTEPLASLRKADLPPGSLVIVAGGEVLSARWLDAYTGLAGPRRTLVAKVLARVIGARPVDSFCRRLLAGDRPLPWVLDAADVGRGRPITYNAVGGLGLGDLPNSILEDVRRRLGGAAFISVRDPESRALLESWDLPIDVLLSPDSAVLAPRAFPISELLPASARKTREAVSLLGSEFLTFQVGRYPAWGAVPVLAEEIRKIHRQTGLGVLLLPLGQAAGHEDLMALRGIADLLPDLPVELLDRPDVVDVLACIATSRLFVGSSLHGNLMALVYGVPHVGFGDRVRKLDLMFRTWDPSRPDGVTAPTGIAELATRALVDNRQDLEAASASLADKAMAAFEQQSRLIT
jgi:hypothetical protein